MFADEQQASNNVRKGSKDVQKATSEQQLFEQSYLNLKELLAQSEGDQTKVDYNRLKETLQSKKLSKTDLDFITSVFDNQKDEQDLEEEIVRKHIGDLKYYDKIKTSAYFNAYLQDKTK